MSGSIPVDDVKGNPECIDWFEEHGHDPRQLRAVDVLIDEDGHVHVERYLLDKAGHRRLTDDLEPMAEPVVIRPTRPFPIQPKVGW